MGVIIGIIDVSMNFLGKIFAMWWRARILAFLMVLVKSQSY
jgi:hypothetical protein